MNAPLQFSHLRSRALVGVRGPDWRSFLQGLLTQDVETLEPGEQRYAALLTPQGRLLYDMIVVGTEDGCRLDVAAACRHDLAQRLSLYRLRAKVEIGPAEGGIYALWGGPAPEGWTVDPRLAELGARAIGLTAPPAPGATEVDEDAYDLHRMGLSVPDADRDRLRDRAYPIEANLDLLHAIDFKKGCFVGQETTSRMKRRGQIRTRMLPLVFQGQPPAPGTEVLAGEMRAGETAGGREGRGLALLRLDRLEAGPISIDGRPARVETPDWLAAALIPNEP